VSSIDALPGDRNGYQDVYLYDREQMAFAVASAGTNETHANGNSWGPDISGDGTQIVFCSEATNIAEGDDRNHRTDGYIHDRTTRTTTRVAPGASSISISHDGRYVVFSTVVPLKPQDRNGTSDIYRLDRLSRNILLISGRSDGPAGNGPSVAPTISADGQIIAFASSASDLVPGDDSGSDVFLFCVPERRFVRIWAGSESASSANDPWPAALQPVVSGDGSAVAFVSEADGLVTGDANGCADVFVYDVAHGSLEIASIATDGKRGDSWSRFPDISADGRHVVFTSFARSLVPEDANAARDVFLRDRTLSTTTCISTNPSGIPADGDSGEDVRPSLSNCGRYIAFSSCATDLIGERSRFEWDAYVVDRLSGRVEAVGAVLGRPEGSQ
jgi:Tol biopolymer transport system component